MTDEELMESYKIGTISSFNELYDRYKQKVMGFLFKKVKEGEREEVFQLVFTRLHEKKHLYNSSQPFAPWFFTLIRNVIIDHYRRGRIEYVELNSSYEPFEGSDSEDRSDKETEASEVLNELKEDEAILLYRKFVDGLTYNELEKEFSTKSATLRKRISRLVKKLGSQ